MIGGSFIKATESSTDRMRIRSLHSANHIVRLASGVYVDKEFLGTFSSDERLQLHIAAQAIARPSSVIIGASAAIFHRLPLERFPVEYPLEFGRTNNTRATVSRFNVEDIVGSGGVALRSLSVRNRRLNAYHHANVVYRKMPVYEGLPSSNYETLSEVDLPVTYRDIRITNPLITALDLARWHSLECGVMALDYGLRNRLFTHDELLECAEQLQRTRGSRQVRQAVRLATPWSESPMESRTKVGMWRRGFPIPLQQVSFYDSDNVFIGRADFYFPEHALIVEYDGKGKYAGEYGVEKEQAQLAEYLRQRNLHDAGVSIVRLTSDANSIDAGLDRVARRLRQSSTAGHLADVRYTAAGLAWQPNV